MCAKGLHVRAGALERAGIPYTPAVGSILLWVDLRAALPEPSWRVQPGLHQCLCAQGIEFFRIELVCEHFKCTSKLTDQ